MRIEQLTLERYGIFSDRTVAFDPDAALHVVLGANEAGKTSALSAIGDLLFGFGGRTDYGFRHDARSLRIGGVFRHSDGRRIAARRRKGNKNTLLDADDQPLADDTLAILLGGVSREAFSREFGMTSAALRHGGDELLSAGGRLAETLAASSAGMAELSKLKDRLHGEAEELFSVRRSGSKPFYLTLDRRDAADRTFRDAVITRDALQHLEAAVADTGARLQNLNDAHASSGRLLARWQRTLRVRSQLTRLESIDAELAALGDLPPVSSRILSDWDAALREHLALAGEVATSDAAAAVETAEIGALAVDDALLAAGATIEALRERVGEIRKATEDLPRRKQARDNAELTLNDAARKLGLDSHATLLQRLPTEPALAVARDLIEQMRRVTQTVADSEARHSRARQELDDFAAEQNHDQLLADIDPLRERFDALGDIPAQQDRLRRERASLALEMQALADAAAALDPVPGVLDSLRAVRCPDLVEIGQHASAMAANDDEVTRLQEAIAALDQTIAATEAELSRLSGSGAAPTRSDLRELRDARNADLVRMRDAVDADRSQRAELIDGLARTSQRIDGITDLLLVDTERATLQEDARRRIVESRRDRTRDADKLAVLHDRKAAIMQAWQQCWHASGLVPRAPADMLRWRQRLDEILARLHKCDVLRVGIDALAARLEAGTAAVIAFLDSVDRRADRSLAADVLYREAKGRFDQLLSAWGDAKARAATRRRLERDITEADAARNQAGLKRGSLQQAWPDAMAAIGLAVDANAVHAEAALGVWASVGVPKAVHERELRSVETIVSDLQEFERNVFGLIDRLAPELRSLSAQDALARMCERLADGRRIDAERRRLRDAATKRSAARAMLGARLASGEELLGEACAVLGRSDIDALPEPVARLLDRQRLEGERHATERHLREIGDGHDEHALMQEREGVDFDRLRGDIEREELQQTQLLTEIAEASADHHRKQSGLDSLMKGRDAVGAAAERAVAGAELLSIAERWLLRSAASRLASHAINLHRAKVQDPTIARAGQLFAMASAEAFAGLGVDYGEEDLPVLVAQRADGERVRVSGLSEGTRDQLYLALRMALLERRSSEPLPFIGDDLLASFDERRTLATLRLLASAGRERQIILFTHHRHVADLAASLHDHRVDLIDL